MKKLIGSCLDFVSSKTFLYLSLAWFVLQGIYFAISIKFGIPPDENYHFTYIQFFSNISPSPFPTHQYGYDVILDAIHSPFFIYHYILSFPYRLIGDFSNAYIVLRLLNIALGVGALLLIAKMADFLKISALARNLSIFMLANTLMFTFIFSAISYDNLFIFLSLACTFLLIKLIKKVEASTLLLFFAALAVGLLTKINFLPMAFIVLLVFVLNYYKRPKQVLSQFKKTFSDSKKLNIFLVVIISFLSIFFVQRYIFNQVNYGNFEPPCQKTRALQECRKSDLFVRNEMIYAPDHPAANRNLVQYSKGWLKLIEDRTFGAFAQRTISANKLVVYWSGIVLLTGLFIIVARWRKIDKNLKILIYVSLFYSGILFLTNLNNYHASGRIDFAVHGRYLFGILPLIYLVWNQLIIERLKNPSIKISYVVVSILIFAACAFPVFIQNVTPVWYSHWYQGNFIK